MKVSLWPPSRSRVWTSTSALLILKAFPISIFGMRRVNFPSKSNKRTRKCLPTTIQCCVNDLKVKIIRKRSATERLTYFVTLFSTVCWYTAPRSMLALLAAWWLEAPGWTGGMTGEWLGGAGWTGARLGWAPLLWGSPASVTCYYRVAAHQDKTQTPTLVPQLFISKNVRFSLSNWLNWNPTFLYKSLSLCFYSPRVT